MIIQKIILAGNFSLLSNEEHEHEQGEQLHLPSNLVLNKSISVMQNVAVTGTG